MIYTAVIVACLVSAPTDCRQYELPLEGLSSNPSFAFVEAQSAVAQWFNWHRHLMFETFWLEPGQPS